MTPPTDTRQTRDLLPHGRNLTPVSFTNLSRGSTAANGPMGIFSLSTPKQSVNAGNRGLAFLGSHGGKSRHLLLRPVPL